MDKPRYKTALANPPMASIMKKITKKVQIGTREETKKISLFSAKTEVVLSPIFEERDEWVETGQKDETQVDFEQFQRLIAQKLNDLALEGYRVISIMPIDAGIFKWGEYSRGNINLGTASTCYSYGFSYTSAAIITAELIE
jgi:hypothetical protein